MPTAPHFGLDEYVHVVMAYERGLVVPHGH
jgi:hypothetical protein